MARIRQIRDVITTRQAEERKRDLGYKEIEVQAILGAIHGAAGNVRGAKAAQQFRFHKQERETPSVRKLSRMFPAGAGAMGMFTDEQIAAEAARQKSAA